MAHLLLIEADKLIAQDVIKTLKRAGHKIDWEVEPQSAIHRADEQLPELVILDILLTERGGIEFLYEFRSYPEWQSVPIILYSQISARELGQDEILSELNVAAFLYKPETSLSLLSQTVEQVLARKTSKITAK